MFDLRQNLVQTLSSQFCLYLASIESKTEEGDEEARKSVGSLNQGVEGMAFNSH